MECQSTAQYWFAVTGSHDIKAIDKCFVFDKPAYIKFINIQYIDAVITAWKSRAGGGSVDPIRCKNRSHRRTRQEASRLADPINKNAEKMYSLSGGCGNFGRGDRRQLLTNGEFNLHTPTPPVCSKINEEAKLHVAGKKRGGNKSEWGSKTTAVTVPR